MNINIEKLKVEVRELSNLINEYETIYYNLYNELSGCSSFWNDNNSVVFFDDVNIEKVNVGDTIKELREICSLYDYLIDKYGYIGNKLKFNIGLKDDILLKFDKYLDRIYNLLGEFRSLEFSFSPSIASNLYGDIDRLINVANMLVRLKDKVKKQFNLFEEIEKEISLKISRINIEVFKENDIQKFI